MRAALAAGAVAAAVSAVLAAPEGQANGSALYRDGSVVAQVRAGSVALRAAPGSSRVLALAPRNTEFGSRTTFAVTGIRGRWAEVISPLLANDERGFVRRSEVKLSRVRVALDVDLSARRLRVWRGGVILRRLEVAVGAAGSPTPIGRFAVTDQLTGFNTAAYGCCILALSGHQTNLPAGWTGGDRLAIHGGGGIGSAVSSGCLHAGEAALRWLLRRVPLGTQVVIHA
ncbi:MAG: L,D-transpeptidase [Gaiellaceae bacterium]|jgi:lipoprotein-anchoring transpeptidase ErfK/SrfK